jgi:hypothetical protein
VASVAVVVALTTASCSVVALRAADEAPASSAPSVEASPAAVAEERARARRHRQAQRILDRRARAVRKGRQRLFLAHVYRADRKLLARQRRAFRNLRQLPLAVLDYTVERDWNPTYADRRWQATAYVTTTVRRMKLDGYDPRPVRTELSLTFAEVGGRLLIVADDDVTHRFSWDRQRAPWDETRIRVVERDGVLGIFDRRSRKHADRVVGAFERGIDDVSRVVPFPWSRSVVVYALANRRVVGKVDTKSGDKPRGYAALAFEVRSAGRPSARTARRVVLHPRAMGFDQHRFRNVVAHEVTHAALGRRNNRIPRWLSEGVAEYVATHELTSDVRWVPLERTRRRAERGVEELPSSVAFNSIDEGWHYALAEAVCDEIANTVGEDGLWRLVRRMSAGSGTSDDDQRRVLRRELGLGDAELARRGAARLVATAV